MKDKIKKEFIRFLKKTINIHNFKIFSSFLSCKNSNSKINTIHIIGDSHVGVFDYINKHSLMLNKICTFVVEGATIQGMLNPNSKTDAFKYFKRYIYWNINKKDYLGIMLGEVDCGFVMWYRANKYNITIEEQLELTLSNYELFISNLIKNQNNIIIFSVPLPTIKDNEEKGIVANLRNSITVTQKQRTELTLIFNDRLSQICMKYSLKFINLTNDILSKDTGLISDKFINKDKLDHHLDNLEFSKVIIKNLDNLLLNQTKS